MKKYILISVLTLGAISQAKAAQSPYYYLCNQETCKTAAFQDFCRSKAPAADIVNCNKNTERLSIAATGKGVLTKVLDVGCSKGACVQRSEIAELCVWVAQKAGLEDKVKNCAKASGLKLTAPLVTPAGVTNE